MHSPYVSLCVSEMKIAEQVQSKRSIACSCIGTHVPYLADVSIDPFVCSAWMLQLCIYGSLSALQSCDCDVF
jgi:hypothetical protein